MRRILGTLFLILALCAVSGCMAAGDWWHSEELNVILVLTDDMRADDLEYMPKVRELLVEEGTTFSNAFVTYSSCCPSRASTLRGQYTHNHQVLTNGPPYGGVEKFREECHEDSTVATWLQDGGYRTVLIGKYLNGYPSRSGDTPPDVPPGWDEWYALASNQNDGYYDYDLSENGELVSYGSNPEDYQTDVFAGKVTDYVRRAADDSQPFFMYLAPTAPHDPWTPAPRHQGEFADEIAPRPPSFNEQDASDKPSRVRELSELSPAEIAEIDKGYRKRLRVLLSLDEMISELVEGLEASGELENTYIVFTSDNGYHMGEHRLPPGKETAYEEDIRVPLIVRGPGVPAGRTEDRLALNTDLAPTFAAMGGVSTPSFVDGRSLAPLLTGQALPESFAWRSAFLVEHWPGNGSTRGGGYYKGVRTGEEKYVEYGNGERELYDLAVDPYELGNLYGDAAPALVAQLESRLAALEECAGESCRAAEDG